MSNGTVFRAGPKQKIDPAVLGVLAHLYRGEVFRSTQWRTRLDNSTNWAVVTTGIALSATYSSANASPLPIVLVSLLVSVFLIYEARRYRYYNMWRARARLLETDFYVPILTGKSVQLGDHWSELLAGDYRAPHYHISYMRAIGRRLRKNYSWILAIQAISYVGKLAIHPVPAAGVHDLIARAAIGPISGGVVILGGLLFHGGWLVIAIVTMRLDQKYRRQRHSPMPEV